MSRKLSIEERAVRDLLKQKRKYERYFKSREQIDNQALSAYTNLIKTVVELARKSMQETRDPEETKRLAREILETDYGIKR